ncbi:MAG: hypothetical protein VB878_06365 [Pirellulaceae bacterium]
MSSSRLREKANDPGQIHSPQVGSMLAGESMDVDSRDHSPPVDPSTGFGIWSHQRLFQRASMAG